MQKIWYVLQKEFIQVFRTRVMIGILFVMPLIQTLVLGFAITNEVKNVPLVVCDLDKSTQSQALVRSFLHTPSFVLAKQVDSPQLVQATINNWESLVGLIIPAGFGKDLNQGNSPQVGLLVDGIDGNTAGVAAGYAGRIISTFGANATPRQVLATTLAKASPVDLTTRLWYNPALDSAQFMVPGIVVILVTITAMLLSSMALVREKEIGTLEQLMVTPINKTQLLVGKLIPFMVMAFAEMFFALLAARYVFDLHFNGSLWQLAVVSLVYIFTALGLGMMVSTKTSTQQQAMFFSWFLMVFMLLLSGLFIPVQNMPQSIKYLTYLNPMRYFIHIMREMFLKGSALIVLRQQIAALAGYGLVCFSLGVLMFKKRGG